MAMNVDPLHSVADDDNGAVCPTVDFAYPGAEPIEILIPISQRSAGLIKILQWLLRSQDFAFCDAKVAALSALLDPVNSPYRNLSQIAREAGISRATLSKAVLDLRDSHGIRLRMGKSESARIAYRETQLRLVQLGRHASQRSFRDSSND
jgi:hypothetical protein